MKTYTADELKAVVEKHGKWLRGEEGGERADLRVADLRGAYLQVADLRGADLQGAYLRGADLRGADLRVADLQGADLQGAYLRGACLRGAYLQGAYLQVADLRDIKLDVGTKWPWYQLPEGDLVGWKKCNEGIVKLRIPAEAKRTASVVGRKCRAEYAVVLETPDHAPAHSRYTKAKPITYIEGETVRPDKYDDNFLVECSGGVHFFATKGEAEEF